MIVRLAQPEDALAIAKAWVDSWEGAYRGVLPDEVIDARPVARRVEQLTERLTRTDERIHVVEEGGCVQGFAHTGLERIEGECGELYALYLRPSAWGRGWGRALAAVAVQAMVECGYGSAVLWVLESNARARGFYEAVGWRADGKIGGKGIYGDREVRYWIDLRRPEG